MYETLGTTAVSEPTTAHPPKPVRGDISARLAGVGAITFVTTVVVQNLVRGALAPANGAPTEEVLKHFADHRAMTFLLVASFLLGGAGLITFLGGTMRRLVASERRGWAWAGFAGALGVLSLFSVVVGAEQALSVVATHSQANLGAVEGLWALHNSVFAVLELFIAAALIGLSRSGVAAGITPKVFQRVAPVGAALLVIGAAAGPAIAAGDAMPLFGLAGVGFVIWLAFLLTTGIRLVRSASPR